MSKLEWLIGIAKPALGPRPVTAITAPEVLKVLHAVEVRERRESAKRLRAVVGSVFRYAVATGRASNDPTGALRGALKSPIVRHRAAIVEPAAFGQLLRASFLDQPQLGLVAARHVLDHVALRKSTADRIRPRR